MAFARRRPPGRRCITRVRWHRVAALRPQLRTQVELRRQDQRGVARFLLLDESSDDVRRLDRLAYEFVGRCDGTLTVQQIWEALLATQPEEAMTQDEIVRLHAPEGG